jgi:hypothetical protein
MAFLGHSTVNAIPTSCAWVHLPCPHRAKLDSDQRPTMAIAMADGQLFVCSWQHASRRRAKGRQTPRPLRHSQGRLPLGQLQFSGNPSYTAGRRACWEVAPGRETGRPGALMTLLGTKRSVITTTCRSAANCSRLPDKRLTRHHRSRQFGRMSAPMMPQLVQICATG